jgi:hypothetical protein
MSPFRKHGVCTPQHSFHFVEQIAEDFYGLGAYDFVLIVDDKQRDAR